MTIQPSQRSPAPAMTENVSYHCICFAGDGEGHLPSCVVANMKAPDANACTCPKNGHGHASWCRFSGQTADAASAAPEPVPALCVCGHPKSEHRLGDRSICTVIERERYNGSCLCREYRAVSSAPRANESQSPEPLVAESVTKGSPSTVQPLEVMPSADAQRDSRVVAVSVASPADAKGSVSAGDNDLLNDADAMVKRADALGWRGTAAMVRSLASALREARTDLAKAILASNANFNASQRLGAELREAREQLAQACQEMRDANFERNMAILKAEARFENARRAVEQLPNFGQYDDGTDNPYYSEGYDCGEWVRRRRVLEILSSPPQQSVSPTSTSDA